MWILYLVYTLNIYTYLFIRPQKEHQEQKFEFKNEPTQSLIKYGQKYILNSRKDFKQSKSD